MNLEKEFKDRKLRNTFCESSFEFAKVHKCRRMKDCLCIVFAKDYLLLAHYKGIETNVGKFLERYFLQPEIYLPVQAVSLWVQYEISKQNYDAAKSIVYRYINATTVLKTEDGEEEIELEFKPANMKDRGTDPWAPKPERLVMKESEYYHLCSLFIFEILLPTKGYAEAKRMLSS